MNKRVLVTGSSRGIGKEVALYLAKDGFNVVVHCRSGIEQAEAVVNDIQASGGSASMLQFDIADRQSCRSILEADIEENGAFYGIVCNAGITRDNAFPSIRDSSSFISGEVSEFDGPSLENFSRLDYNLFSLQKMQLNEDLNLNFPYQLETDMKCHHLMQYNVIHQYHLK